MKIYISGISGTGMGPLALMAKAAGFSVSGSDLAKGAIYDELIAAGIEVYIGEQDGNFLRQKLEDGVDWFVYTSALKPDHKELVLAKENGVRVSKRDELTAFLISELNLKMVAVAGTHGKTTTTAMIIFAALKLGLPVAYIVGSTLGFAPSGAFHAGDKFFVYEADEYDRNFLKYRPWVAVIPAVSYDHPDIYPTREDYIAAFRQFESQSENVIKESRFSESEFNLAGEARRKDAALAAEAVARMVRDNAGAQGVDYDAMKIVEILNEFPGVGRRFEKLKEGLYSDYAHHPEEIKATVEIAKDEKERLGKRGVVVVYQPHQNTRQHEVLREYKDAFLGADKVFWLPTYLTRENPELKVLEPEDFIGTLENKDVAERAELGDKLFGKIQRYLGNDYLVVLMTAGPADEWLRKELKK